MSSTGTWYDTGQFQAALGTDGPPDQVYNIGPIVIATVASGSPTTPNSTLWPSSQTAITTQCLSFDDYFSGQSRIIGSGFEVHNVTPELYVGGTVTVSKTPQFNAPSSVCGTLLESNNSTRVSGNTQLGTISLCPPGDIGLAMLLPGSRQWEAKKGAYCVQTIDIEDNPAQVQANRAHVYVSSDFNGTSYGSSTCYALATIGTNIQLNSQYTGAAPGSKVVPMDSSSAYFTGLPNQSVLTLTVVQIIETFPSVASPLVTLATDTPDYDPLFYELYKRANQMLPVGVAAGENASGDFWDKVLETIGSLADNKVLQSIVPMGNLIGPGISALSSGVRGIRNKPKEKKDDTNFKGGTAGLVKPKPPPIPPKPAHLVGVPAVPRKK